MSPTPYDLRCPRHKDKWGSFLYPSGKEGVWIRECERCEPEEVPQPRCHWKDLVLDEGEEECQNPAVRNHDDSTIPICQECYDD